MLFGSVPSVVVGRWSLAVLWAGRCLFVFHVEPSSLCSKGHIWPGLIDGFPSNTWVHAPTPEIGSVRYGVAPRR